MTEKSKDQTQAEGLMAAYVTAYLEQDIEAVLGLFVDDGQIDIRGTGADEYETTVAGFRQSLAREFSEARSKITVQNLTSFIKGEAGVVMAEWLVQYQPAGGTDWLDFPQLRASLYVEKHGDNWRIRQGHWSTPLQSQPAGKSFPDAA